MIWYKYILLRKINTPPTKLVIGGFGGHVGHCVCQYLPIHCKLEVLCEPVLRYRCYKEKGRTKQIATSHVWIGCQRYGGFQNYSTANVCSSAMEMVWCRLTHDVCVCVCVASTTVSRRVLATKTGQRFEVAYTTLQRWYRFTKRYDHAWLAGQGRSRE